MKRKAGWIWMIAGILMALLAGFLTFRTLSGTAALTAETGEIPTTPVVVAVRTIPMNHAIIAADIALRNMPNEMIPEGAVQTLESALGRISRTELHTGEILLEQRLIHPDKVVKEALAFAIPEGHVVIALPPADLMSQLGVLQAGDRIDFLVSLEVPGLPTTDGSQQSSSDTSIVTVNAMQNLEITALAMGVLPQGTDNKQLLSGDSAGVELGVPTALLFAVTPQDALILKHVQDAGGIIDIALRAPDDDQFIETDPVSLKYLQDLYRMDLPVSPQPQSGSQPTTTGEGQ